MKNMLQQIVGSNILLTQYILESTQNNLELKDSLEKNLLSLKIINEKLIQ